MSLFQFIEQSIQSIQLKQKFFMNIQINRKASIIQVQFFSIMKAPYLFPLLLSLICSLRFPRFASYKTYSNNTAIDKFCVTNQLYLYASGSTIYIYNMSSNTQIGILGRPATINSLQCGSLNMAFESQASVSSCSLVASQQYLYTSTCSKFNSSIYNNNAQIIALQANGSIFRVFVSNHSFSYLSGYGVDTYRVAKVSPDSLTIIAVQTACVFVKFIKSGLNWVYSSSLPALNACSETSEILFLNNNQFIFLQGSSFFYEKRYVSNLSLITSGNQTAFKFYGNAQLPNSTNQQVYFVAGDTPTNYFVIQYDFLLEKYALISQLSNKTTVQTAMFDVDPTTFTRLSGTAINISSFDYPCTQGQYYVSTNNSCSSCIINCIACNNSATCLVCNNISLLNLGSGLCSPLVTCTSTQYYEATNNTCQNCISNCQSCTNGTSCTTCNPNYLYNSTSITCNLIPTCLSTQYYESINNTCQNCISNCQSCTNGTSCTTCNPNYLYNSTSITCNLIPTCLSTQYYESTNNTCQNCIANCIACSNAISCTNCAVNMVYVAGTNICQTIATCVTGQYYLSVNNTCNLCISNCLSCVDSLSCSSCNSPLVYNSATNICESITICPASQFYVSLNNSCQNCSLNCLSCTDLNICTQCDNITFLDPITKRCSQISSCPQGFYEEINGTCHACDPFCRICTSGSCLMPKYFIQQTSEGKLQLKFWMFTISSMASVPNYRVIFDKPAIFYLTMDRIWLYQYQKHNHSECLVNMFEIVNYLQNQKYAPFHLDQYLNQTDIANKFDANIYYSYAHQKFKQIQRNNGTILENLQNYIIISIPVSIIVFLLFNLLFRVLFNYRISLYLRQFSLWGFLIVSLLQPNIQYSTFVFANQMKMAFFVNIKTKLLMIVWVLGFYGLLMYAVCSYLLYHYLYKKLAKYFVDDCYRVFLSFFWFNQQIGLKSLTLGFIHAFLYQHYLIQLLLLMLVEVIFLVMRFIFWKKNRIFISNSVVCSILFNSCCMLFFQTMLIIQQIYESLGGIVGEKQIYIFDKIQFLALALMLISSGVCFLTKLLVPNIKPWLQNILGKNSDKQMDQDSPESVMQEGVHQCIIIKNKSIKDKNDKSNILTIKIIAGQQILKKEKQYKNKSIKIKGERKQDRLLRIDERNDE